MTKAIIAIGTPFAPWAISHRCFNNTPVRQNRFSARAAFRDFCCFELSIRGIAAHDRSSFWANGCSANTRSVVNRADNSAIGKPLPGCKARSHEVHIAIPRVPVLWPQITHLQEVVTSPKAAPFAKL
ncbi:MAG: hypothetical protein U0559_02375 [Anaerolineae bacterium]